MKRNSTYKNCITLLIAYLLVFSVMVMAENYVDGVVATVGREPILHSDVIQEMLPMLQSLSAESIAPEERERRFKELFDQALEQVVEYHILHLEALKYDITIPDGAVEKSLRDVRKQYGSAEAFRKALKESGNTIGDFRERLRKQIMALSVSRSKRSQFEQEAVVSESDIAQYYMDHQEEFNFPARYRVRRIFLQVPRDDEARDSAKIALNALREKIIAGENFEEAAKKNSNGPEAAEGGMMGWVVPGDVVEPLSNALASLAVGEISPVLETEYGLHLLKLEEKEEAGSQSLAEARSKIEPLLRRQKGEVRYRQWMDSLRQRNNVRILL